MSTELQSKSLKGRDHMDDLDVDSRIMLKCILKK
jgi:hypothetical protein